MNESIKLADAARGLVGNTGWIAYTAWCERRMQESLLVAATESDIDEVRKAQGRYETYQLMVGWLEKTLKTGEEAQKLLPTT